ncbi:putative protein kinase domain containing protein [Lyophyllum shimeji]|uniref:Protein kinase domain-containing protein n=1 Tax=Lyophyllum shimeji TaxID=47721 RepID=A0A9P3PWT4_LYOSH|nr:putative protein kinase domain containing protein [Lyophyllum shimeji]
MTPTTGHSVISNAVFRAERQRIIDATEANIARTNLYHNVYRLDIPNITYMDVWYTRDDDDPLYVSIMDEPGTLSGNILRLLVDLPSLQTHSKIEGNTIRPIPYRSPPECGCDTQDIRHHGKIRALPVVAFDETIHFAKISKYKSEVANLLKVKDTGGSPRVIELLGRTQDGRLVFPRHETGFNASRIAKPLTIALLKRWAVQLAEAVCFLHSIGIIHRDLHVRNVLVTKDKQNMILCDLECRWGSDDAPEICPDDWDYERPYTEKSDVYCFGKMLNDVIMGAEPKNPWVSWSAPAPFSSIVETCKAEDPDDRPTMQEAKAMLEAILVHDDE